MGEIDFNLVNRYCSITRDKVSDDKRGLLAKARLKLMGKNDLSCWEVKRLRGFIKDLEEQKSV
tara:strand:+ start:1754 stop:1942 length:189 start_codon:yes stop_codon:yes gene_type:complete